MRVVSRFIRKSKSAEQCVLLFLEFKYRLCFKYIYIWVILIESIIHVDIFNLNSVYFGWKRKI